MSDTQTIRHGSRRVVVLDGVGRLALVVDVGGWRAVSAGLPTSPGIPCAEVVL